MKRILPIVVILAIIFLLALPKLGLLSTKSASPTGAGAVQAALPVDGVVMRPASFDNTLVITGSILANESLELKAESSGKIPTINFKEGSRVKEGELLVQTNDEEIRAQIEKQPYMQKLNKDNEFRHRQLFPERTGAPGAGAICHRAAAHALRHGPGVLALGADKAG